MLTTPPYSAKTAYLGEKLPDWYPAALARAANLVSTVLPLDQSLDS